MTRSNEEVAQVLAELAELTELDEGDPNSFRVRAYRNAERAIKSLDGAVADRSASELAKVRGIGSSIAARIREFVETGTVGKLEELRTAHPRSKRELLQVPGLGPKTAQRLERELQVRSVEDLVAALDDGSVESLEGMGQRTVENLREGIESLGLTSKDRRVPIATALPLAERIVARLERIDGVEQAAYAGSLRRFREDVGDVDVLVSAQDPDEVHAALRDWHEVERVLGSGETKTSVLTHEHVQVDLRVVPAASFGAALVYFTGSKAHNIRLRQRAQQRGWGLNEYALADADDAVLASRTELEVYETLDLPWITPELREDDGELEQAAEGALPAALAVEDLRGDLHVHTDLSGDGHDPLEHMVEGAVDRGLDYLAITDHAENLRINGVSREQMLAQRDQLRELEQQRGDIRLLHGAELNIDPEGLLDYDTTFLAGFDWLVASVHSHFGLTRAEQTRRVVEAIRHPHVTAIGHLTGRLIGRRKGIELDLPAVLDAAAQAGTAIEINAALERLDASVEVIREGVRHGCTFVISTDAHAASELDRARHGAAQARRAGLEATQVANTRDRDGFIAWVDEVTV